MNRKYLYTIFGLSLVFLNLISSVSASTEYVGVETGDTFIWKISSGSVSTFQKSQVISQNATATIVDNWYFDQYGEEINKTNAIISSNIYSEIYLTSWISLGTLENITIASKTVECVTYQSISIDLATGVLVRLNSTVGGVNLLQEIVSWEDAFIEDFAEEKASVPGFDISLILAVMGLTSIILVRQFRKH